jgi:hypothetical protein
MRLPLIVFPVVLAFSFVTTVAQEPGTESSQQGIGTAPRPAAQFVPARFANGLEAAASEIPFPDYRKDIALYINCAANLDGNGRVEGHFCLDYSGSVDDQFRQLVDQFVRKASISPALVAGERVPVEFYFRVYFGRRGDNYAVGVFPNWGDDAEKYGPEYEAPQRYDREPMSSACAIEGGLARINVDADGQASGEASLIMSYGIPGRYSECEKWFSQSVANGSYVPAMHGGKPVTATYVEMTGNSNWLRLKRPEGM